VSDELKRTAEREPLVISTRTRIIATLSTVALISPATAFAGPDDGKHIATQTHVDSPKTFWEDDNFTLRSEFGGQKPLIDDTVAWIGKGYHQADEEGNRRQNYMYALPQNGSQDYLGEPGTLYYTAPFQASANQEPIWMGFGADTALPTQDFRDGKAYLDLLSVDGPGDVELFTNDDSEDGTGLHRMLGSFPDSPHSAFLHAGTHTHNYTLFTKPGRYRLTYRTSARTKDGELIANEPQTISIQVGGQKPKEEETPKLEDRFNENSSGDASEAGYSLSIDKKENPKKDGDDQLTTFSFDAENNASGTLTLFIDGYFLTDLDVEDGQAQWDEFMGPESSNIQAVFTPDGEEPWWISQQLEFTPGEAVETDSATAAEKQWEEVSDPRELAPTEERELGEPGYTIRMRKQGKDGTKIIIDTDDKDFNGLMVGGLYSKKTDNAPTVDIEAPIVNGHGEAAFPYGRTGGNEGYFGKVEILPHPTVKAGYDSKVITESFEWDKNYEVTGELSTDKREDSTSPSEESTPSQENDSSEGAKPSRENKPSKPSQPSNNQRCGEKYLLDRGHVDIMALPTDDEKGYRTVLKDDTAQIDKKSVERSLDDVVLGVHDNALTPRTKRLEGKKFDFLGKDGDRFYHLPQSQNQSIIWPGYNTEKLDYSNIKDKTINLNLKPTDVPEGAEWGAFIGGDIGSDFRVLANSAEKDYSIETTFASHTHTHWAFTKPGMYTFEATYSATTKDGKEFSSEPQTLTFAIGDEAVESCSAKNSSDEPSEAPSEKPSKPTESPSKPSKPSKPSEPSKPAEAGFNPWGLVLPVVLGITFKAFYDFFRSNDELIKERFGL